MKNILYCLVAIFIFNSSFSQGLKLSTKEELMSIEQFKLDDYGFATNLPSSYSSEKYIPRILNQKKLCLVLATRQYIMDYQPCTTKPLK